MMVKHLAIKIQGSCDQDSYILRSGLIYLAIKIQGSCDQDSYILRSIKAINEPIFYLWAINSSVFLRDDHHQRSSTILPSVCKLLIPFFLRHPLRPWTLRPRLPRTCCTTTGPTSTSRRTRRRRGGNLLIRRTRWRRVPTASQSTDREASCFYRIYPCVKRCRSRSV